MKTNESFPGKVHGSKIIMFCGKGGVGKTTCSAATAIHFAEKGLKTLLLSSDPSPSLSDILEMDVSKTVTEVKGVKNLYAFELDYDTVLKMWKERFGEEVYEVVSSFLPVGEEIIDYIAGAPGIDEEFLLSYILDIYEERSYDVIVWDTAPAGGTLQLLKLEEKVYKHLGEAARLYLRVKGVLKKIKRKEGGNPLDIINDWRELSERTLNMLKDENTEAIVVTIPEALGVYQTGRIIKELGSVGIRVSKVIVNYVLPEDLCDCDFFKERVKMQKKYIDLLKKQYYEEPGLIVLPLLPQEVKGIDTIRKIEKFLFRT